MCPRVAIISFILILLCCTPHIGTKSDEINFDKADLPETEMVLLRSELQGRHARFDPEVKMLTKVLIKCTRRDAWKSGRSRGFRQ